MNKQKVNKIIDEVEVQYDTAILKLRASIEAFIDSGTPPSMEWRKAGGFAYPEMEVTVHRPRAILGRAPASRRHVEPGQYRTTITQPRLYRAYLINQLTQLSEHYECDVVVRASPVEIPFPYVIDGIDLGAIGSVQLAEHFPTTDLAQIGDEISDGEWMGEGKERPLALFDALRTDFSLARLKHYTGTPPEHFQKYVLFTNYHRYVDAFVRWGCAQLANSDRYTGLSCTGGNLHKAGIVAEDAVADSAWRRHQMPAYHLMTAAGDGITLVNIGVGPSNAKTLTDHLAVLRPEAWLMIGHCGGLRPSQLIGDYVLAHAYLRDDHVLDELLPPEMPVPPIAEIQQALQRAAEAITREDRQTLRQRLRTGAVVTVDDRNWELRYSQFAKRFHQSRAVAVDMESATIATQGQRFRVPHGTLLCVSDKPLHGEIKLPGQANRFYDQAIREHIEIGIATVDLLREAGDSLHSRKLRAFNEPPFR